MVLEVYSTCFKVCFVDTANQANRIHDASLLVCIFSQLSKGVDDDTKNQIQTSDIDKEEESQVEEDFGFEVGSRLGDVPGDLSQPSTHPDAVVDHCEVAR